MRLEWNGKKPLTKIKALYICWRLWEWLAETGTTKKEKWPGWKTVAACLCFCPCCEQSGQDCEKCLIKPVWGNPINEDAYCESPDSPYQKWKYCGPKARKKYALIIANFAKKEYLKEAKKSKRR